MTIKSIQDCFSSQMIFNGKDVTGKMTLGEWLTYGLIKSEEFDKQHGAGRSEAIKNLVGK